VSSLGRKKMTKEEISDKLNELLDLSDDPIDFTKLSKEDLTRLFDVLTTPATLISLIPQSVRDKILNRPLRELLEIPIGALGEGGILSKLKDRPLIRFLFGKRKD